MKIPHVTACLSGAAKLARRQRGEEKCSQCERDRKLVHRNAGSQRGRSAVVVFAHFFFFLYFIMCAVLLCVVQAWWKI